jgi:hypothetical protein
MRSKEMPSMMEASRGCRSFLPTVTPRNGRVNLSYGKELEPMKRSTVSLVALLLLSQISVFASAQISAAPPLLSFQSRLLTPGGNPVAEGTYFLRFSLAISNTSIANSTITAATFAPNSLASGSWLVTSNSGIGNGFLSTTFPDALDTIRNRRDVTSRWKRAEFKSMNFAPGRQIGFIAQEVEKVLPEMVSTDDDGYKSVTSSNLAACAYRSSESTAEAVGGQNRRKC